MDAIRIVTATKLVNLFDSYVESGGAIGDFPVDVGDVMQMRAFLFHLGADSVDRSRVYIESDGHDRSRTDAHTLELFCADLESHFESRLGYGRRKKRDNVVDRIPGHNHARVYKRWLPKSWYERAVSQHLADYQVEYVELVGKGDEVAARARYRIYFYWIIPTEFAKAISLWALSIVGISKLLGWLASSGSG